MDDRTGAEWLVRVAVGGGSLLLLARVAMALTREPVRRQRLGEWGMVAALLLAILSAGPAWVVLPLPSLQGPGQPTAATEENPSPTTTDESTRVEATPLPFAVELAVGQQTAPQTDLPFVTDGEERTSQVEAATAVAPVQPTSPAAGVTLWGVLLSFYVGGAAVLLGHRLLGHAALARLLRRTRPAPPRAGRVFADLAVAGRRPRLRVADRVRVPFSCGLFRPTVVLPAAFAEQSSEVLLRWVLAHELAHVERHDALGCLLLRLGQVVYYPLPWLWSLCRQVRLCQEYLADAAAVAGAGSAEDYAQFLLGWAAVPSPPAGVAGVSGRPSDLYRRITMLLQFPTPVERRCPRRWAVLTGTGLVALAVLGAGVGRPVAAAPAPQPEKARAEEPTKEAPLQAEKPEPEKHDRNSGPAEDPFRVLLAQSPEDDATKALMEERERINKILQDLRGNRLPDANLQPGIGGAVLAPGMAGGFRMEGRLGVAVSKPGETLAEQLDLPKGQGLALDRVAPKSAADKAGMKAHDILLELDGKPVPSDPAEFVRQLAEVPADKAVDAVVMRRGKRETLKGLKLPEPKAVGPGGVRFGFGGPGSLPPMPDPFGNLRAPGFGAGAGFGPGFKLNVNPPVFAGGGKGVMTTTFRTDDHFTSRHQEGSLVITVTGKVEDGKAKVGEIQVQDGRESHKYDSLEKVPEAYRDKAKHLSDLVEKDGVRIRVKGAGDPE
jgi:beta-lactamase regulating signal transducer with metallopeptidase domain